MNVKTTTVLISWKRLVHIKYEILVRLFTSHQHKQIPGTDNVDHSRAVKRFKRPAAGDPPPLPSDVRPPPVLMKTLNYLIYDVLANNGMDESYTFLRDRQRAIRSDFQLQNYRELEAVKAFELMARYSVMAQHRVATEEKALLSVKQEIDQMNMVLQSLSEFYEENARRGYFSPNEAEFRAYYILSHIWNPEVISLMEREVRPEVLFDPRVQHAMKIRATLGRAGHSSAHNGGSIQYAEFFRLVRDPSTTYLMACLMEMHFVAVRKAGFQAMQRAYYSFEDRGTWFPGDELMELMCFDNIDEVVETLEYYSIPVEIEGMGDDTLVWAKFGKIRSEGTMQRAQFERRY
ncbi:SAC3/GANP/Nin1/mts3/eIF-3 p25 family-domain-containing protein [Cladochytrium replicatum]|nr:SAC3/GANP/Nin1/mts3/eIF-3 p25 family-domain-containing protein [Cladochytrium replicatum]